MPDTKYQLFISQACHIHKGSQLGGDAKRRNKKKKRVLRQKKGRIHHRGEKGGGRRSQMSLHDDEDALRVASEAS